MNTFFTHAAIVWAYQLGPGPDHSHTWVTITRSDGASICISWNPAQQWHPGTNIGRNYSHEETLAIAKSIGARVYRTEPFTVSERVWSLAAVRLGELTRGSVLYKLLDCDTRPYAVNCITAASLDGNVCKGFTYGWRAARIVAQHLRRL
jgi:hypothetical protein